MANPIISTIDTASNTINNFMISNFWITSILVIFYSIITLRIIADYQKMAINSNNWIVEIILIFVKYIIYSFFAFYITLAAFLILFCSVFTYTKIEMCIAVISNKVMM